MRIAAGLVLLLMVGACSSRADQLEKQYGMMQRSGASKAELCGQSRKVVQALLDAGDEAQYKDRKLSSDIECSAVEARAALGL